MLLDPATHLDLLDAFAGAGGRADARWRRRSRAWQRVRDERERLAASERARTRRAPSSCVPARRDRAGRAERRRRRRAGGDAAGARQRRPAAAALRATPTTRSTKATQAALPALGDGLEEGRRARGHRRALRAVPRGARRREVAARGSRVLPALVRRRHRRVAGAAAGGRRPARAARASEEEARPDARRRDRTGRGSCAASSTTSSTATERRRSSSAALAAARARVLSARRAALSAPTRGRGDGFATALERSLADLAMAGPAARSASRADRRGSAVVGSGASTRRSSSSRPTRARTLRPLARIASGGELSRIMLALKTLASTDAPGKTLIFDEVDAGIGGAVADVVGGRLQRAGAARSRCSASRTCRRSPRYGATHFHIAKAVEAGTDAHRRRPSWQGRATREEEAGADDRGRRTCSGGGPAPARGEMLSAGERAANEGERRIANRKAKAKVRRMARSTSSRPTAAR